MQLPIDEEYDEKVVGIPESFEIGSTDFLSGEEYYDSERNGHDPTGNTGTRSEVCAKESQNPLTGCLGRCISHGELVKVYHVGQDMDNGKNDHRPGSSFVEGDVFIKGNDIVQGSAS
jgi:hypothetical protein